jgi:hypothetical protein
MGMQEDQTATFQPIYEGYQPWFAKVYALYLLIVIVVMLFRSARFIWQLRGLRKGNEQVDPVSNRAWTIASPKATSSKSLATLTFFVSMLNLSWWTADILFAVRTEKAPAPNLAYILPEIGDALTAFSLGIIVSIALYGGSMLAQFAMNRRRQS